MEPASDTKKIPRYFPTSTPIVDGFEPLPSRNWLRLSAGEYFFLSGTLILGLIGLPVFRRTAQELSSQGLIPAALIVCLLIPAAGLAVAVAVHEAGHLVAAWLAGLRQARAASSASANSADGWRPSFRGLVRIGPWNLEPRSPDHLSRRLFAAVLGGPTASFAMPLVLGAFIAVARPTHLLVFCLELCAAQCFLLGVAEVLPDMGRGATSDGARLLMLLRKDALADRWVTLARFQLACHSEQRLRDLDEAAISGAVAVDDDSRDAVAANWIAYWWACERQDITSAAKYLEESLDAPAVSSEWLRDRLFLEAAIFQAWFREDLEKASMWAVRIRHGKLTAEQECRLSIALLWANGRLFDAWEKLSQALARFQPNPAAGDFAVINWPEWKKQMESRMLTRAWRALYSTTQAVDGSAPSREPESAPEPAPLPN
jgi:hypothetical protein